MIHWTIRDREVLYIQPVALVAVAVDRYTSTAANTVVKTPMSKEFGLTMKLSRVQGRSLDKAALGSFVAVISWNQLLDACP